MPLPQTAPAPPVPPTPERGFSFDVGTRLADSCAPSEAAERDNSGAFLGRTGTITTPHGTIATPAFIAVGTKATVKAVLPESMRELGAQALLANAYHLFLQPGADLVDEAGGLGAFMNWPGPTFTDSGGFQVMSLGAGFKKVINMDEVDQSGPDDRVAAGKERLAHVDDDGVWFKSHLNGDRHRFTPEVSMRVQHQLGADIIFAFDELTTLQNSRAYQETSLERTRLWAERCIAEHRRLTVERAEKPYQALFGVLQGAQHEDLRRKAAQDLGSMDFDGYGIGGALEKENLGTIVRWCSAELPEDKPRHLLGISEPDDIFLAIENGADTFDCVSPTRVARTSAFYTPDGRMNLSNARFKRDFGPLVEGCGCYACANYSRAYIHHLFRAKEMVSATLVSIHNEYFVVTMVDDARRSIEDGTFFDLKAETLRRYYPSR
ncbi:MAG TPA: tRNA guanosine(34) transglycosylase Tgt [Micrococcaceae bacterium]|nr:tRNA guanosine(34) transglycosylase Tgt [Micrococcaceae bacterium]